MADQNNFLSGVTSAIQMPLNSMFEGVASNLFGRMTNRTNANLYNQYQDITFPRDTSRMLERMNTLYPGTNPWERLGTGAASPLPSPMMEGNERAGQSALPLQLAKIQSETQLAVADKNNATAERIATGNNATTLDATDRNNATAKSIAEYAQTGPKAVQETALAAANTIVAQMEAINKQAQTEYTRGQTAYLGQMTKESDTRIANMAADTNLKITSEQVLRSDDLRRSLMTLAELIPRETWSTPGYNRTGLAQADPLINLAKALAEGTAATKFDRGDAYMRSLTPHDLDALTKAGLGAAGAVQDVLAIFDKARRPFTTTTTRRRDNEGNDSFTETRERFNMPRVP